MPEGPSLIERLRARLVVRPGPLPTPCWIFTGAKCFGYGYIGGRRGFSPKRTHRVMWEHTHGDIPAGSMVLHKCDVRACCNPEHLYVGSHADNTRDAVERRRFRAGDENGMRRHPEKVRRGEQHHSAKVTPDLVRELRRDFDAGKASVRELADRHSLDWYHVNLIVKRRRWKHVD